MLMPKCYCQKPHYKKSSSKINGISRIGAFLMAFRPDIIDDGISCAMGDTF